MWIQFVRRPTKPVLLHRNLKQVQSKVKLDAYEMYVESIKLCSNMYSPHTSNSANKLKSVQKLAVVKDYRRTSSIT